jgi:hypothetical protein
MELTYIKTPTKRILQNVSSDLTFNGKFPESTFQSAWKVIDDSEEIIVTRKKMGTPSTTC